MFLYNKSLQFPTVMRFPCTRWVFIHVFSHDRRVIWL